MSTFDEKKLKEMGIVFMNSKMARDFSDHIQEELEVRIGGHISEGIPREKLEEFDRLTDPGELSKWLKTNRPDYKDIIEEETKKMEEELKKYRTHIKGVLLKLAS